MTARELRTPWKEFRRLAGAEELRAERTQTSDTQVHVLRGLKVSWGSHVDVFYNPTFSPKIVGARRSTSLPLRPDVGIHIRCDGREEFHVLDAKLRIQAIHEEEESDEAEDSRDSTFKNDDIAKMHAYRDALPYVQSAHVLYPGSKTQAYPAFEAKYDGPDGVGAIALTPGGSRDDLVAHLRLILRVR